MPAQQLPEIVVKPPNLPPPQPDVSVIPPHGVGGVDLDNLPDWKPPDSQQAAGGVDLNRLSDWKPSEPRVPEREVGGTEATLTGIKSGLSFGFEPEYRGMAAAGAEVLKRHAPSFIPPEDVDYLPSPILAHIGAAKALWDWTTGHDDPEVSAAHERGRKFAQETVDLSREQHPLHFYGGLIAGSLAVPGFGPELGAASAGERIAAGVGAGGVYGGLAGTGEAVSRGESPLDVAKSAGKGIAAGAAMGGALHGIVGPREPPLVPTAGQRAAATAEDVTGKPILPRGYASDRPIVRSATAKFESAPIAGPVIRGRVGEAVAGASRRVQNISEGMTQGVTERAGSDPVVRSGLQDVLDSNKAAQNALYDKTRSYLAGQGGGSSASVHRMPRTQTALDKIAAVRREAGENPEAGLETFRNIVGGTTFNGAHRAKSQAANPNLATKTNPGYSGGDYKQIMAAMKSDLRAMVVDGALANAKNPNDALRAFDEAEARFGPLKEQNDKIENLLGSGGETALAQIMAKGAEKSGDLATLRELKQSMPPDKFAHIGGTILRELGVRGQEFSAQTFLSGWGKMSNGAKAALFDPAHRQNIDEIIHMFDHIGVGRKDVNVSKTANALLGIEMLSKIGELGIATIGGLVEPTAALKAVGTLAIPDTIGFILASPAKAASTRAYLSAYRGLMEKPTPARTAAFKPATRNLGNNLGVPAEKLAQVTAESPSEPKQRAEVPRR
jgi:hypothetical protein